MSAVTEIPGAVGGYEKITPGATATGISSSLLNPNTSPQVDNPAVAALVTVESNAINFTLDGTTPTNTSGGSVGHKLDADQSFMIRGKEAVQNFECIDRVSGSNAAVKVTVFHPHNTPHVG